MTTDVATPNAAPPRRPPPSAASERVPAVLGGWLLPAAVRALPSPFDRLSTDFGPQLYEDMAATDPVVGSGVATLLQMTLADGAQLLPAVAEDQPDGKQALVIRDFCQANLDRLPLPLEMTLYDLGRALITGSETAEIVYTGSERLPGATHPQWLLDDLTSKPHTAYRYVVDRFNKLLGVLYADVAGGWGLGTGTLTLDPPPINFLPRWRLFHLPWRPPYRDPRGSSLMPLIYAAWWAKQQLYPELLQFLATSAIPPLVGTTAPEAPQFVTLPDGSQITSQEELKRLIAELRNASGVAVPHGSGIAPIAIPGDGAVFTNAFNWCDRQITLGLLHAIRTTQEAQHGSKADSITGKDLTDTFVSYLQDWIEASVRSDLLTPLVLWEYGPQAKRLVPRVQLRDTSREDFATNMTALAGVGYRLHRSQFAALDARNNVPARDAKMEAADAAAAPRPPPPPPGAPPPDQAPKQEAPPHG